MTNEAGLEFEMTDEDEVLPCPFCGTADIDPEGVVAFKPEYRYSDMTEDRDATPDKLEFGPACNQCGCTTDGHWNTRAKQPRELTDTEIAALLIEHGAEKIKPVMGSPYWHIDTQGALAFARAIISQHGPALRELAERKEGK